MESSYDNDSELLSLNPESWKVRIRTKTRGAMRIIINLDADETVAFNNFTGVAKPEDVPLDDFCKAMFITGIEAYRDRLVANAQQQAEQMAQEAQPTSEPIEENPNVEVL